MYCVCAVNCLNYINIIISVSDPTLLLHMDILSEYTTRYLNVIVNYFLVLSFLFLFMLKPKFGSGIYLIHRQFPLSILSNLVYPCQTRTFYLLRMCSSFKAFKNRFSPISVSFLTIITGQVLPKYDFLR